MAIAHVNGVDLYYELQGSGEPLVLVHGSWGDHHNWDAVVGRLSQTFQVLTYDRRGHSASERPAGQGSVYEDVDDLAALTRELGLAPAHIVGNSGGAAIVLRTATRHPEVFRTLVAHEPPMFPLLAGTDHEPALPEIQRRVDAVVALLEGGDEVQAARIFVETVAFGPGAWEGQLDAAAREVFVRNAPTFLDEARDPDFLRMDLDALAVFDKSALLTSGTASGPFFGPVVDKIAAACPRAERLTIDGANHVPHLSMPAEYVRLVTGFVDRAAAEYPAAPSESVS
jgi:pimeloyl-ACP methyl ester carboxylesterase